MMMLLEGQEREGNNEKGEFLTVRREEKKVIFRKENKR